MAPGITHILKKLKQNKKGTSLASVDRQLTLDYHSA